MMSERIPLHVLPTFAIAARLENLRAAAQQVHLTHGAVSQQIQLLEQAVGSPLFERRGRGVRLNAAGRELLAAVEPALQALQQGVARARRAAASQTLRISVLPSFAHYWLLPRLSAFHEACADIALDIDASLALQDLSQRGFDAAIRIGSGQWAGLQAQRIASGTCCLSLRRIWRENGGGFRERWRYSVARARRQSLARLVQRAGAPVMRAATGVVQRCRIIDSRGRARVWHCVGEKAAGAGCPRRGRLVALAAPCRLSDDDVYLAWPQTAGLTPAVTRLLQWLQQQLAAI